MKSCKLFFLAASFSMISMFIGCTSTKKDTQGTANQNSAAESGINSSLNELNSAEDKDLAAKTIYFDFNKYNIRTEELANAKNIANFLKAHAHVKIQIQGNTDDRGSSEYNLALGTKRARALQQFLLAEGVENGNIDIVSYGKEHPAVQGNGESVLAQNRRDDVVIQH